MKKYTGKLLSDERNFWHEDDGVPKFYPYCEGKSVPVVKYPFYYFETNYRALGYLILMYIFGKNWTFFIHQMRIEFFKKIGM